MCSWRGVRDIRRTAKFCVTCSRCVLFIHILINYRITFVQLFPVPILAASDLIQALTLIIATFGFYSDFFITFDRSNWRRVIRDAMDGTHPKVL